MRPFVCTLILAALVASTQVPVSVRAEVDDSGYLGHSKKGWWWYEREEPAKEELKKEEPKKAPKKQKKYPSLKDYSYDELWNMDPTEFGKIFEGLRNKAYRNPSEANTKEYYQAAEIVRKKSQAFTNSSEFIWQKYPELTLKADYPTSTPGNTARVGMSEAEKKKTLHDNREQFALVVFNRPGCQYCVEEAKILDWFTSFTNWIVKPVDISRQPDLAQRFGVSITPSIILIMKGSDDYIPVTVGAASADEIIDKTYRGIRLLKKEITPEEYELYDFQRGGGFDVRSRH